MRHSDLFHLLKSLSQAEIRHFRIRASGYKKTPKYMKIFDLLLDMEEWDAVKFRKKLTGISSSGIALQKNYLFNALLQSLVVFQRESSHEIRIRNLLDEAEVLAMRGMDDMARKILAKVRLESRKVDAYPYLLLCRKWEKRLTRGFPPSKIKGILTKTREEEIAELKKMENESEILFVKDRLLFDLQSGLGGVRIPEDDLALPDESDAISFEGKLAAHTVRAFYHTRRNESRQALPHYRRMVELWESNPGGIKWFPERYAAALTDYLGACNLVAQYEDYDAFLKKLGAIRFPDVANRERFRLNQLNLQLIQLNNTDRLEEAEQLADKWNKELEKSHLRNSTARILPIWFNFTLIWFFNGSYKKSLRKIVEIIAEPHPELRADIRRFVLFLRCILHIELGNKETLADLRKSLPSPEHCSALEKNLLFFFEEYLKNTGKSPFPSLLKKLDGMWKSGEVASVGFQEVHAWLMSRCLGLEMRQALKKKREEYLKRYH